MNRRVKAVLIAMPIAAVSLIILVAGWVAVHSRDVPAPDVSALHIETIDVPDENNAYVYFEKAADSFEWERDDSRVSSVLIDNQWDEQFVTELLSRNAQTLALVKRGLACPAYQPPMEPRFQKPRLSYFWSRDIGELLEIETLREKRAGRVLSARKSCFDRCRLSSLFVTCPRSVEEYASGLIVLGRALNDAGEPLIESAPQETDLVRLLGTLNSIGALNRGLVRAIKEEFRFVAEAVDEADSTMPHRSLLSGYMFQPNRTKQMCVEFFAAAVRIAPEPYSQVRLPEFKPLPASPARVRLTRLKPNGTGRVLAGLLVSRDRLESWTEHVCYIQSRLDGLRLVVACRLYEIRHGKLPETLDALVPECLSEVPRDPFDGKPFRYLPDRGVVYTIGQDLKDSSASAPPALAAHQSPRARPRSDDQVYEIHAKSE